MKGLIILIFPGICHANTNYIVDKIGEALYTNSVVQKELESSLMNIKYQTPDYIVRPMEILLPTLNALREGKFELRYMKEF